MAEELERIYTVPLRNSHLAPLPKRAKRAVTEVRSFLARHMKADPEKVWIDNPVNELLWARGIQKPPRRIRVRAIKFEDGIVEVSLPDVEAHSRRAEEAEKREAVAAERAAALAAGDVTDEEEAAAPEAAADQEAEEAPAEEKAEADEAEPEAEEPAEKKAE